MINYILNSLSNVFIKYDWLAHRNLLAFIKIVYLEPCTPFKWANILFLFYSDEARYFISRYYYADDSRTNFPDSKERNKVKS